MTVRVINADVLDGLRQLPDESVHCVVTSPPYWGLRDYGTATWEGGDEGCNHSSVRRGHGDEKQASSAGTSRDRIIAEDCKRCGAKRVDSQIGLEKTPAEFVSRMVEVFREVRRVLRADGVCFVNLGDSYAAARSGTAMPGQTVRGGDHAGTARAWNPHRDPSAHGLKHKDLCGIPWRVAFALQDDGWWLRQDIIWAKPNPMPESVTDRCTKAHEYIFHLTKSERYWWDQEAIKETALWPDGPNSPDSIASPYGQGFTRKARKAGNKSHKYVEQYAADESEQHRTKAGLMNVADVEWERRNKRSVWTMATTPFPEAHFATFPPELPETCIKAGCPKGGTVLDPFGGAGTTGLVADRLQRHAILIELNPEYAAMAERRVAKDRGALLDIMENCA